MEDQQMRQAPVESIEMESQAQKTVKTQLESVSPSERILIDACKIRAEFLESGEAKSEDRYDELELKESLADIALIPQSLILPDEHYEDQSQLVTVQEPSETREEEIQVWGLSSEVEEHGEDKDLNLLKAAYLLMEGDISGHDYYLAKASKERELINMDNAIYKQKGHMDNTMLHIAASFANDMEVEKVARQHHNLVTAKNSKGDTPLHFAAKAGHITTLKSLLAARLPTSLPPPPFSENLSEILAKNESGNSFFHEALSHRHTGVMNMPLYDDEEYRIYKEVLELAALFQTNREQKSGLYLAIEAGDKQVVEHALAILIKRDSLLNQYTERDPKMAELIPSTPNHVPPGKSPMLAAIIKKDLEILKIILKEKPEWIHLKDKEGRTPLHYAAYIGYLDGVLCLLEKCPTCALDQDKSGFFPVHMASHGGHLKIVKHLVKGCVDATEMLNKKGQNIFHIAAQSGKLNVVKYILGDAKLQKMINEKDGDGNTALHLATIQCHSRIVHTLTWTNEVVDLNLVNNKNQTALDLVIQDIASRKYDPTLKQDLIWIALKSAGARQANSARDIMEVSPLDKVSQKKNKDPKYEEMEHFRDTYNTLLTVSTLIITATFAACFAMPGGYDDSAQGMSLMLNRTLFHLFIFCITISMYGSICVTVMLIFAQGVGLTLMFKAIGLALPILGITVATLSLAFMAGVYLVISQLTWLAITFLVMSFTFFLVLLLFYFLFYFPSASRFPVKRYVSYYPIRLLSHMEG